MKSYAKWSARELDLLRRVYEAATAGKPVDLTALAALLGRDKANVCRKARSLGLTNQGRAKRFQLRLRGTTGAHEAESNRYSTPAERHAAIGRATRARIAKTGHPRGMLGKKHSPEALARIAAGSLRGWAKRRGTP